jgi:hypothetical protein
MVSLYPWYPWMDIVKISHDIFQKYFGTEALIRTMHEDRKGELES